jgi:DNA primase
VARDPEEWKRLIENAKPVVTHVMETLAAGQDLKDAKVKNRIAAQVLPLIEDLPNPLERDTYRQQLARLLRVDERALETAPAQGPRVRRTRAQTARAVPAETPLVSVVRPTQKIEAYCLGVLFRRPELLYKLDRQLEQAGLSPLAAEDFEYTDHQLLIRLIRQSVEQDEADHHQFVSVHVPEALAGLTRDLLARTEKLDPLEERLLEELFRSVIKMRRLTVEENINQLRFIMEEAQQEGDLRVKNYQELALQHNRLRHNLDRALQQLSTRR